MQARKVHPFLSIVVPVYNGSKTLAVCLSAIVNSNSNWELIVVNDGSTDDSAVIAENLGATVLETKGRLGPGAARNLGTQVAKGEYVCFIDADCEVHGSTLINLVKVLEQHPGIEAVFGSYDDTPKAPNFIAQYRNLLHHYVHQTGCEAASTFWAGCGAVKRSTFLTLGGFDTQRYQRPCIEDIELGYRIRKAGGKILLAKQVQVKHHKAWDFLSLLKTDVLERGIPWTLLLMSDRSCIVNDLNLQVSSRTSVVGAYALLVLLGAGLFKPQLLLLAIIPIVGLMQLNWNVYRFFYDKRGASFALRSIAMHWFYYLYCGVSFVCGLWLYWWQRLCQKFRSHLSSGKAAA